MPVTLPWQTIALRLALTVFAGFVIGLNRGEHGRPAGIRTTLLVCLAASLAMLQANLLMNSTGKAHDSFVVIDLMRLPLGILSGMGFIGAGTILRRDDLVIGITTAATLWFVTVMGLCFGGGQIGLGLAALILGLLILWGLKFLEQAIHRDSRSILAMIILTDGPADEDIRSIIHKNNCKIGAWGVEYQNDGNRRILSCEVLWKICRRQTNPPPFIPELSHLPGVAKLRWQPQGIQFETEEHAQ
ncbi:MAG TPA: MgtC/SapB family protein [Tepidisphaeraceae bacterium]|jgi:putative Mg2+ transporter-C (MgtC) family protein|nr:MgtC/SapB family protein [Tepidisphaeraceae bacterium]